MLFLFNFHLCPKGYCDNLASPLTGIFEPNGGLASKISKTPHCILD